MDLTFEKEKSAVGLGTFFRHRRLGHGLRVAAFEGRYSVAVPGVAVIGRSRQK